MTSYDSINDLIRDLSLDRNHWINKESFRFVRKPSFDRTAVNIKHVPNELIGYTLHCKNGHTFSPDWLKKRHPVSTFFCKERGLLRQSMCHVECPVCSTQVEFNIPQAQYNGELEVYGDEAHRVVDGKNVFIYSFISFSGCTDNKNKFEAEYCNIKRKLAPSIPPKNWVLHMKELTSKEKWSKQAHLKHLDSSTIYEYVNHILDLIGRYNKNGDLNIYSSSGIVVGEVLSKKEKNEIRSNVYNSVLMRVVRETTTHNLAPKFYFEKTGDDGWAKNLFDGGRLTLLWAYITNGLPVMSPQFVSPITSLYLEVADIVSYLVARYLYCVGRRAEGANLSPEFDISRIEKVRYVLTNGDGNWLTETSKGFPSDVIFKGTNWENYA